MSDVVAAWQAALAAEHQAVFGYGLLGPQLSGDARQLAETFAAAHARLRDATEQALAAAAQPVVAAEPDYPDLYPVRDAAAALGLALRVEEDCATAWRFLYLSAAAGSADASAATPAAGTAAQIRPSDVRGSAQQALTDSAVRAARWRALRTPSKPFDAFPGVPA